MFQPAGKCEIGEDVCEQCLHGSGGAKVQKLSMPTDVVRQMHGKDIRFKAESTDARNLDGGEGALPHMQSSLLRARCLPTGWGKRRGRKLKAPLLKTIC